MAADQPKGAPPAEIWVVVDKDGNDWWTASPMSHRDRVEGSARALALHFPAAEFRVHRYVLSEPSTEG